MDRLRRELLWLNSGNPAEQTFRRFLLFALASGMVVAVLSAVLLVLVFLYG